MSPSTSSSRRPPPPGSGRGRRPWPRLLALALAGLLGPTLPGPASPLGRSADQEIRARDLEVFEELLERAVAESVHAKLEELRAAAEAETGVAAPAPWGRTRGGSARGIFLEGYGVLFAVQLPDLYPLTVHWLLDPEMYLATELQDAMRAMMGVQRSRLEGRVRRLQLEMAELSRRLAEEAEAQAEEARAQAEEARARAAEAARQIEELLGRLREQLREAEVGAGQEAAEAAGAEPQEERPRRRRLVRLRGAVPDRETAERMRREVLRAIVDSLVDTLGRYGRILRGLGPADHVGVVVLPSAAAYHRAFGWLRERGREEDVVVSVRYADIEALDLGQLSAEEFRQRVRITGWLGEPRPLAPGPQP